jgi:hypothetical protein
VGEKLTLQGKKREEVKHCGPSSNLNLNLRYIRVVDLLQHRCPAGLGGAILDSAEWIGGLELRVSDLQTIFLDDQLAGVAPRMDTRVQRRVARELWNSVAGVRATSSQFPPPPPPPEIT